MAKLIDGEKYSYQDVLATPEGELYELIHGVVWRMRPHTPYHQTALMGLTCQFYDCPQVPKDAVWAGPVDVLPFVSREEDMAQATTLVLPDVFLVSDRAKLVERGILGPPDLVAEILDPETEQRDRTDKFDLYQEAGVREYWLIDHRQKTLTAYVLEQGVFLQSGFYAGSDKVPVSVLDHVEIDLSRVFL